MKGIWSGIAWVLIWATLIVFSVGLALIPFALYAYLTFSGAEKRQAKAFEKLASTIMAEEKVISQAIQHRIFALWNRRVVVAITNSRLVLIKRGLLGGFNMQDIQWKDLDDAKLNQNVLPMYCGSNLIFSHLNASVGAMEIDGIPDREASDIYTNAQAEEQAWEEKRRIRSIEEVRAASGGIAIHTGHQHAPVTGAQPSAGSAMLEQIENAKRLLDSGAISDAEFQEMKSKIISAA